MAEQSLLFEVRDQREPGWFFVDNEIVDRYGVRIGAYGLAIYNVLCRHCKNATQQVSNLSQRDIAATLQISQDRVRKSLLDLVELQLIHVDLPARPAPGMISTITLLKVKTTERHTFSSASELNATRSPNKEEKTKTETKTKTLPNPPLQGGNRVTKRDLQKVQKRILYNRARFCKKHPGVGLTQQGSCWGCYSERYSNGEDLGPQPFFPVNNDELRDVCLELLLHYEDVREALDEIQLASLKKEPERATG